MTMLPVTGRLQKVPPFKLAPPPGLRTKFVVLNTAGNIVSFSCTRAGAELVRSRGTNPHSESIQEVLV